MTYTEHEHMTWYMSRKAPAGEKKMMIIVDLIFYYSIDVVRCVCH